MVNPLLGRDAMGWCEVRRRYPHVTAYGVERVERVMGYLAGLGVDVKRVVEMYPALLGLGGFLAYAMSTELEAK